MVKELDDLGRTKDYLSTTVGIEEGITELREYTTSLDDVAGRASLLEIYEKTKMEDVYRKPAESIGDRFAVLELD